MTALELARSLERTHVTSDSHAAQIIDELADEVLRISPTDDEADKLASMRDELLSSDWAYWHDDPAVLFLNKLLGDKYPPKGMNE